MEAYCSKPRCLWSMGCAGVMLVLLAGSVHAADVGPAAQKWINRINRSKPDVVMIGNSMQGEGIDFPKLSRETKSKVMNIQINAAGANIKYCVLHYAVAQAQHKPKIVMVVTRQCQITYAWKRLHQAKFKSMVNAFPGSADRKILDAIAFPNGGKPPSLPKGGLKMLDSSWDFPELVNRSFLPYMIQSAREEGILLVIIMYKARLYAEDRNWHTGVRKEYLEDLTAYLKANGTPFLSYALHPAIKAEHYANGDHLNRREGRALWTSLVAQDLNQINSNYDTLLKQFLSASGTSLALGGDLNSVNRQEATTSTAAPKEEATPGNETRAETQPGQAEK